jgi:trehalose/maltose transport system permease protein
MSIYAREFLFDFDKFGYGSAASTLLFLTIALMTIAYITVGRVSVSGEAR